MKAWGRIADIQLLERLFIGAWGVSIVHDGSKRFSKFGKDGLKSAVYHRSYLVHVEQGLPALFTEKAVVKFFYNHIQDRAAVYIPDDRMVKLTARMPELGGHLGVFAVQDPNIPGEPMVKVVEISLDKADILFRCPRCGESHRHTCEDRRT